VRSDADSHCWAPAYRTWSRWTSAGASAPEPGSCALSCVESRHRHNARLERPVQRTGFFIGAVARSTP
jgi:hypothetical protein